MYSNIKVNDSLMALKYQRKTLYTKYKKKHIRLFIIMYYCYDDHPNHQRKRDQSIFG